MADDAKIEDKPEPSLPPLAGKAKDLEALRNAVVDAANVSGALWFSYLFVLLYLAVAVGSVTHRNLLFESPVKLPFLNVDLPLLGFFTLGPAIFLVVHAYVLLHFAMLADKVGAFHAELQAQIADDDIRTSLRRQLPSNIFVQFLAGPREVREGILGMMLRLIAQISLVVGPLALLVLFLIQFLPYHHEAIAWWHRLAIVLDLALLWLLWPSVARGETTSIRWSDLRRCTVASAAVASLIPILFVFTIATFPGESLDRNPVVVRIIPVFGEDARLQWISTHEFLFGGDVDFVARKPTSLWSNRLVLPNVDLLESGKLSDTFSLRGRELQGAVLAGARLSKVDFTAANLQDAVLDDADLGEANFGCAASRLNVDKVSVTGTRYAEETRCAQLQRASFDRAHMQGAKLDQAKMQGASLKGAKLQSASLYQAELQEAALDNAHLSGASLESANLQGASLVHAQLQGASLSSAKLSGANLDGATLRGASLEVADLRGASLRGASFQGALLNRAALNGAELTNVEFQGASLIDAQLQGAWLHGAQLQGANFKGAAFAGAWLHENMVWRADAREANLNGVRIVRAETRPKYHWGDCATHEPCDWSAEAYAALKQLIETSVPQGAYRAWALERIAVVDPAKEFPSETAMAETWTGPPRPGAGRSSLRSETSSASSDGKLPKQEPVLSDEEYEEILAEELRKAACVPDSLFDHVSATYASRAIVAWMDLRFRDKSPARAKLAVALLEGSECQGIVERLTEYGKDRLRDLAKSAADATPPAAGGKAEP